MKCKNCGMLSHVNEILTMAWDRKDLVRWEKTGLCPYCKKERKS